MSFRSSSVIRSVGVLALAAMAAVAWRTASAEPLKVAAIYTVPIQQQWVSRIHTVLIREEEAGRIDYVWSENIPNTDYVRVMREYAESGKQLIVGESFGIGREARAVADEYPNINFLMGDPGGPHGANFSVFDTRLYEAAYLMGVIAGSLTKSNVVGMVGGFPLPAQVNRSFNAFMNGARAVNPAMKFTVSFIGSWYDPPKAKEAAKAQIEAGADLIYAERDGVVDAAREAGILAFGHMTDKNKGENGANVVATSAVWNMQPAIAYAIDATVAGRIHAENYEPLMLMAKGGSTLAPYYELEERIPPEVRAKVAETAEAIRTGAFQVPVDDSEPSSSL